MLSKKGRPRKEGRKEGQRRKEGRKAKEGKAKDGRKEGRKEKREVQQKDKRERTGGGTLLPSPASFLGSPFFAERALKVEGEI